MKFKKIILAVILVCIILMGQMHISADTLRVDSSEEDISISEEEREEILLTEDESDSYYKGLQYYLNYYKYSCEAEYIQAYLEYLQLEIDICKAMIDTGDITEADVKVCEAEYAMCNARKIQAVNESAYYNLYLKEKSLDYSDFKLKEDKKVHDVEYYFEQYPACDHMSVSRCVTDYRNAVSYIEAQKLEVEALRTKLNMAKLLLEEGELSKQAFSEQQLALAKAEYELEGYYINMNASWAQLMGYIGM